MQIDPADITVVHIGERTLHQVSVVSRGSHATTQGQSDMSTLFRFVADESGATAIEYGLIAALIAVAIIAAATMLGSSLSSLFYKISGKLNNAA